MSRADNLALANAMREQSLAPPPAPPPGPPPDIDAEIARKMSLYRGEGSSLDYAQALRGWEEENLPEAIGLGFVPGVGQLYGAASAAAALRDPEASMLDKGLSVAGMLPLGSILKALRGGGDKMEILGHHGGRDWDGPPKPIRIGGEGNWTEGPGFYTSGDPNTASGYAETAFRGSYSAKPPTGAKPLLRQYEIDNDVFDNQFVNLKADFDSQPEAIKEALIKLYPADTDYNKLARYMGEFTWGMGEMHDRRVADLARQQALAAGIRGNDHPFWNYIVPFDPETDMTELRTAVPEWWTMNNELRRLEDMGREGMRTDPDHYERVLRASSTRPNDPAYDPRAMREIHDAYSAQRRSEEGLARQVRRENPAGTYKFDRTVGKVPGGKIYDFPAALRSNAASPKKQFEDLKPVRLEDYTDELGKYPDNYDPAVPDAVPTPAEEIHQMMKDAPPSAEDLFPVDGKIDAEAMLSFGDYLGDEFTNPGFLKALEAYSGDTSQMTDFIHSALNNLGYDDYTLTNIFKESDWPITLAMSKAIDELPGDPNTLKSTSFGAGIKLKNKILDKKLDGKLKPKAEPSTLGEMTPDELAQYMTDFDTENDALDAFFDKYTEQ